MWWRLTKIVPVFALLWAISPALAAAFNPVPHPILPVVPPTYIGAFPCTPPAIRIAQVHHIAPRLVGCVYSEVSDYLAEFFKPGPSVSYANNADAAGIIFHQTPDPDRSVPGKIRFTVSVSSGPLTDETHSTKTTGNQNPSHPIKSIGPSGYIGVLPCTRPAIRMAHAHHVAPRLIGCAYAEVSGYLGKFFNPGPSVSYANNTGAVGIIFQQTPDPGRSVSGKISFTVSVSSGPLSPPPPPRALIHWLLQHRIPILLVLGAMLIGGVIALRRPVPKPIITPLVPLPPLRCKFEPQKVRLNSAGSLVLAPRLVVGVAFERGPISGSAIHIVERTWA